MDEHRHGRRHAASSGRGAGLTRSSREAAFGCALALVVVVTTTLGSSRADPAPASEPAVVAAGATVPLADRASAAGTTSPDATSSTALAQVFAVLARAERAATESGRPTTPQIEQAAAELGMLLSSYLATHADAAAGVRAVDRTEDDFARVMAPQDLVEDDTVTFADVWAATLRLAALLDPDRPAGAPAPRTAPDAADDEAGTPLTESLREVVARWGDSTDGYLNGRIPAGVLCPLRFAPGQRLRCDADAQLERLDTAYRARFGTDIPITDSYRPYDVQVRLKAQKGWLAATPGYSNHGWGLAVDLGSPVGTGASAQYVWLRLHGPDYGWDNPSWARLDGSKPEPWHFEFFAAGPMPSRALSAADVELWQQAASDPGSGRVPDPVTPAANPAKPSSSGTARPHAPAGSGPATAAPAPTPSASSPADPAPSPAPSDSPSPTASDPGTTPTSSPADPAAPPSDSAPAAPIAPEPATVVVPDVSGRTADDALTALVALGFVQVSVSDERVPSDTTAAGLVAATTPAAGSSESVDTAIVLVLSAGPADAAGPPSPAPAPSGDDSATVPPSGQAALPRRAAGRRTAGRQAVP